MCLVFLTDSQQPVFSSQGLLISVVRPFPPKKHGKTVRGKLAELLLNLSTVPWYGLAAQLIAGRGEVDCGCHIATCSGPRTAMFMWPAGERGVLNTGIFFLATEEVGPVL